MLKKIIKISLFGVSALAIMNVNAATTSRTDQNTIQDLKPTKAVKVDTSSQGEVPAGVYVTGQVGYAQSGLKVTTATTLTDLRILATNSLSNGIAGRVAVGYKLTNHVAMEVGFLNLSNGSVEGIGQTPTIKYNLTSNQYAIDVAAKGMLPVAQNVNVYGKVGVAYLTTRVQVANDSDAINFNQLLGIAKHKWAPEVAVGVSYDLTPNVSIDTSITHIHPVGSNKPGNINFMAVGLGYTFG